MDETDKVRQALLSNLLIDVSPYMQDDKLCDKDNPDSARESVACKQLLLSLYKKWEEEKTERAETRALLTFLEANHLSREWVKGPDCQIGGRHDLYWGIFQQELADFFEPLQEPIIQHELEIFELGRVGPGAAQRANCTSFYGKMGSSLLTATSLGLYSLYRDYVSVDPRWRAMENIRCDHYGDASLVSGSIVSFAPKNVDTARLIGTEPSLNMWAQLGLCAKLEDRMRQKWNVCLDDQPDLNRLLARMGSRSGDFATIDLSSASDCLSLTLCRESLPGWVFGLLSDLRSPVTQVRDYGLNVELGCMSMMGNGFTFPLMTVLLSCAIRAVYSAIGIPIRDNPRTRGLGYNVPGNWAVFGDDIIVCREAYDEVIAFLQSLGFRANVTKSFNIGPFRESCGHDYFKGHPVRGVYLKKLTSRNDISIAVNLLNDWTYRTGIPLCNAVQYLVSLIEKPLYVPYSETDDAGIKVPSSIYQGRTRPGAKYRFKACYERSVARQTKVRIGDGVVKTPKGSKRMVFNEAAALLSLLLGELRDGSLIVRLNQNTVTYQTRWQIVPNWDLMPPSVWVNPQTDWPRWETAVWCNLMVKPDPKA